MRAPPRRAAVAQPPERDRPVGERRDLGVVGDEHGGAPGDDAHERVADQRGGDRVEVRGRLVDEDQGGIAQCDARERDAPPLAGTRSHAALAQPRLEPAGQPGRPASSPAAASAAHSRSSGAPGSASRRFSASCRGQQHRPLRHPRDPRTPRVEVHRAELDVTAADRSVPHRLQPEQDAQQRRLPRAARPHDRGRLARATPATGRCERNALAPRGDGDVLEHDRVHARGRHRAAGPPRARSGRARR